MLQVTRTTHLCESRRRRASKGPKELLPTASIGYWEGNDDVSSKNLVTDNPEETRRRINEFLERFSIEVKDEMRLREFCSPVSKWWDNGHLDNNRRA